MKKLLSYLCLLFSIGVNAQITNIERVGLQHVMFVNADEFISNNSIRITSFKNLSLKEAFPDMNYDITKDSIYFYLGYEYYTIYLPDTKCKYSVYNKTKTKPQFFNGFLNDVVYIRQFRCSDAYENYKK